MHIVRIESYAAWWIRAVEHTRNRKTYEAVDRKVNVEYIPTGIWKLGTILLHARKSGTFVI